MNVLVKLFIWICFVYFSNRIKVYELSYSRKIVRPSASGKTEGIPSNWYKQITHDETIFTQT